MFDRLFKSILVFIVLIFLSGTAYAASVVITTNGTDADDTNNVVQPTVGGSGNVSITVGSNAANDTNDIIPTPGSNKNSSVTITNEVQPNIISKTTPACQVGGCSGQLCVDSTTDPIVSTCEWKEEYGCYKYTKCGIMPDGKCGWANTPEFQSCLSKPLPSPIPPKPCYLNLACQNGYSPDITSCSCKQNPTETPVPCNNILCPDGQFPHYSNCSCYIPTIYPTPNCILNDDIRCPTPTPTPKISPIPNPTGEIIPDHPPFKKCQKICPAGKYRMPGTCSCRSIPPIFLSFLKWFNL